MATPRIFISYRRDDTSGYAGRLADDLREHFGPDGTFMDIDTLEPGADWVEAIENAVGSADALIALIGPKWLTSQDAKRRRRLNDPNDYVRREIVSALNHGIRVIPVLIQDATMPGSEDLPDELVMLTRRQAHEISDARWRYDVGRLIETLGKLPGRTDPAVSKSPSPQASPAVASPGDRDVVRPPSTPDARAPASRLSLRPPWSASPRRGWIGWIILSGAGLAAMAILAQGWASRWTPTDFPSPIPATGLVSAASTSPMAAVTASAVTLTNTPIVSLTLTPTSIVIGAPQDAVGRYYLLLSSRGLQAFEEALELNTSRRKLAIVSKWGTVSEWRNAIATSDLISLSFRVIETSSQAVGRATVAGEEEWTYRDSSKNSKYRKDILLIQEGGLWKIDDIK